MNLLMTKPTSTSTSKENIISENMNFTIISRIVKYKFFFLAVCLALQFLNDPCCIANESLWDDKSINCEK